MKAKMQQKLKKEIGKKETQRKNADAGGLIEEVRRLQEINRQENEIVRKRAIDMKNYVLFISQLYSILLRSKFEEGGRQRKNTCTLIDLIENLS